MPRHERPAAGQQNLLRYKRHFHNLQWALAALAPKDPQPLAQVAALYAHVGNLEKALLLFRQAKKPHQAHSPESGLTTAH